MPLRNDDQRFLELLDKWISGDFTRTDLLEIRQLAASDPFRADAWEGFNTLPEADHQQQLDTLRRRLNTQPDKRVGVRRWWFYAAAAASLLLIGIALPRLWLNKGFIGQEQAPLAAATEKQEQPDGSTATPANAAESTALSTENHSATLFRTTLPPAAPTQQPGAAASTAAVPEPPASDQAPPPAEAIAAGGEAADEVLAEAPVTLSEAAEDKIAAAPPPAPVARSTEPLPTAKPTPQSTRNAKAKRQSPAEAKSKDWADTDTKSNMDSLRREARKADQPAESEPVNGWDAFNQFARGAARLTPQARAQNVSGSVRVQFSVSPEGEPQNFVFLRRLGYGLDDQAKTIIQNWAWIPGVKNSVIVEISFVR